MPSSRRGEALLIAANANLSGHRPAILLSQKPSAAQTSHGDVCCLRKREFVGMKSRHFANAKPFCRFTFIVP